MAFSVRPATVDDLLATQALNLQCLPENYQAKYYFYKRLSWPQLQFVAEDISRTPVGYTLGKIETEGDNKEPSGHITSLGVLRTHRQGGLARALMNVAHKTMTDLYDAETSSLHVRVTNLSAFSLYCDVLGYKVHECAVGYYENNEDAFSMKKQLVTKPTIARTQPSTKDKKKQRRGKRR